MLHLIMNMLILFQPILSRDIPYHADVIDIRG